MNSIVAEITNRQKKSAVVDVRPGDTVKVHQKIREGSKERVQIFEGLVIRTARKGSLTSKFTVRRVASGVGVEKSFMIHSPSVVKVEVTKRSKVRRNYLSYMRGLSGKSTRLSGVEFDRDSVNAVIDEVAEAEAAELKETQAQEHEAEAAAKAEAGEETPVAEAKPAKLADEETPTT